MSVSVTVTNSGASTQAIRLVSATENDPIRPGDSLQTVIPNGGLIALYPIYQDDDRIYTPSDFSVTQSQGIYNVTQHWTNDDYTNAFGYLLLKANTSGAVNVAYYGE